MKRFICILTLAVLLLLGGCGSSETVTYGRYAHMDETGISSYLILREDGTCSFKYSWLYGFRGTYKLGEDGILTVSDSDGKAFKFAVDGTVLTYDKASSDKPDVSQTDDDLPDGAVFELRNTIKS